MLNSFIEYEKMFNAEKDHWWYKSLHELVLCNLSCDKNIEILDAGCGTGGLISFLTSAGYKNIQGFDLSDFAVNFCKEKNIEIQKLSLTDFKTNYQKTFDVITSLDVLYFLNEAQQKDFLRQAFALLNQGGLLILNLPAGNQFCGIHDLAVGIKKRFCKKDIFNLIKESGLTTEKIIFWPFLLSPVIFFTRLFQRLNLAFNKNKKIVSDVDTPHFLLNDFLYKITKFENKSIKQKPLGSSVFIVLKKVNF